MTVIVFKDGVFAADRSITANGQHLYEDAKIFKGDKAIGGYCGSVTAGQHFANWIKTGCLEEFHAGKEDDWMGLVQMGDSLFICDMNGISEVPLKQHMAIGSGSEVALGALDMGANADEAAWVSANRLGCAQYGIDVMSLDAESYLYHRK
jgi:20S proteasome alpha/beta subunit